MHPLPWEQSGTGLTPTSDAPRRHGDVGLYAGAGLGLVVGGIVAGSLFSAFPAAKARNLTITLAAGLACVAGGWALGEFAGTTHPLVTDSAFSPERARTADVQALVGHALASVDPTLDQYLSANQSTLPHPITEYVVDHVIDSGTDQATLVPDLYSADAKGAVADADHARALVRLDEGSGPSWAVVNLHHDAAAAAAAPFHNPGGARWQQWQDPAVQALTAHIDVRSTHLDQSGATPQSVVEQERDLAVINGGLVTSSVSRIDVLERGTPTELARTLGAGG